MKTIAIITARGGSKRIPKKNIKDFCGMPIIAYSIKAAIESNCFDIVMVSTDNEEIASISKNYGAEVPFMRSEETSNDFATTADVLKEVLDQYEKIGKEFDYMCCLYPTAPFVTSKIIQDSMNKLINSDADSLVPVVAYSFPPQRGNIINNGRLEYKYPEYSDKRSQDLETMYHDCGQFYISKVDSFKKTGKLFNDNTIPIVLPEEKVQDIDNISDWKLAEIKFKTFILEGE